MNNHRMSSHWSQWTVRDYVCARCWGHLLVFPDGDAWRVECHRCGADTPGFVTKRYADNRRSDSVIEKIEVDDLLRRIGAIQKSQRSAQDVLKVLGF